MVRVAELRPSRAWANLKYRRLLRRLAGPRLLRAFAGRYPEAVFVEIGANDGEHHDHLRPLIHAHDWSGIMVEPVPYVFERLRENYGRFERLRLENVAIAARDGTMPFYHLAEAGEGEREGLPHWYHGLGSFSRETVLGHARAIPDIEARIVSTEVRCLTFASLCRRHELDSVDLVVIDTEGFDWEILRNIDLRAHRPRLIVYEHFHLSDDERSQARRHLAQHGYETMEEGFDTFALDTAPDDRLSTAWRRLEPAVPGVSVHDRKDAPSG